MNTTDTEVMGINYATLEEVDVEDADYFIVALVTRDEFGKFVSHQCFPGEYGTYEEAVVAARTACVDDVLSRKFTLDDDTVVER